MSTLAVNAITDSTGGSTATINSATPTVYNTMGKNLIINGAMQIWQRGTSVPGSSSTTIVADRWKNFNNIGTTDVSQSTDTPSGEGFGYSHKVACASTGTPTGGNECYISQVIEAQNLQQLAYGTSGAKQITISFWVKSNLTGSSSVWLYQYDGARDIAKSFTINSANTWEKKTVTFDGDVSGTINNDNGAGLDVRFYLSAGPDITGTLTGTWDGTFSERFPTGGINFNSSTSNNLYITGVQLEVGSVATEFERRPYGMELQLCQRYYCKTFNIGTTPANNAATEGAFMLGRLSTGDYEPSVTWRYPVEMRVGPTITLYNPESGTSGQWSAGGGTTSSNARSLFIGTSSAVIDNTDVAITGASGWRIQATASAEL